MSTIITQTALILCFVAGKSGGHLLPCITQAEKFLHTDASNQVYLFSSGSQLDKKIMEKHPLIHHIMPAKLDRVPYQQPWLFPLFLYQMTNYFVQSLYQLWCIKPAAIISFGGLNSIPVCLAGMLLGYPFQLHELNVEPGQSIQFLSRFTDTVYIYFSQTAEYFKNKKWVLTPYPIRFTDKDLLYDKDTLLHQWHLSADKKTILILGGSQGSVFINQAIKESLQANPDLAAQVQIIHQVGSQDSADYQHFYDQHAIPAVVFAYNEQLQNFYNLADCIICRAGAGTLFEVAFFKKPCIIIPLQTTLNNHQVQNAYAMQTMFPENFSVLLQDDTAEKLESLLLQVLAL